MARKRGRTPLQILLEEQHPELRVDSWGGIVLIHPLQDDGTANTALVELRDERDGKLLARMDRNGLHFLCRRRHELFISHQDFARFVAVVSSSSDGLAIQLQCDGCNPPSPLVTFLTSGGIIFDSIDNLTTHSRVDG